MRRAFNVKDSGNSGGNNNTWFHIVSFYGNVTLHGQLEHTQQRRLFLKVFQEVAHLGNQPILITMDANFREDKQTINDMLATAVWIDLKQIWAGPEGPEPTFSHSKEWDK